MNDLFLELFSIAFSVSAFRLRPSTLQSFPTTSKAVRISRILHLRLRNYKKANFFNLRMDAKLPNGRCDRNFDKILPFLFFFFLRRNRVFLNVERPSFAIFGLEKNERVLLSFQAFIWKKILIMRIRISIVFHRTWL